MVNNYDTGEDYTGSIPSFIYDGDNYSAKVGPTSIVIFKNGESIHTHEMTGGLTPYGFNIVYYNNTICVSMYYSTDGTTANTTLCYGYNIVTNEDYVFPTINESYTSADCVVLNSELAILFGEYRAYNHDIVIMNRNGVTHIEPANDDGYVLMIKVDEAQNRIIKYTVGYDETGNNLTQFKKTTIDYYTYSKDVMDESPSIGYTFTSSGLTTPSGITTFMSNNSTKYYFYNKLTTNSNASICCVEMVNDLYDVSWKIYKNLGTLTGAALIYPQYGGFIKKKTSGATTQYNFTIPQGVILTQGTTISVNIGVSEELFLSTKYAQLYVNGQRIPLRMYNPETSQWERLDNLFGEE